MKNVIYGLALVGILLSACTKEIAETTGGIAGVVSDARSHEPLAGVSVSLSSVGRTVATGADGRYRFSGLDAQEYTVQVSGEGYQSDRKTVQVIPGETAALDFQLTPSTSSLGVSQSTLDFGNNTTTLAFDILNNGFSTLSWQISEDIAWLSCTPTSGTVASGEKVSVVAHVERTGLEPGEYSQTIAISSNGGSQVMRVDMSVLGISVSFSPEVLDFGSVTTSMQLTLTNLDSGDVSYALEPSNDWIQVGKTSGTFARSEVITVSVDRSQYAEGDYDGKLILVVGEDQVEIPVKMNIPAKAKPTVSLQTVEEVTFNSALFRGAVLAVGSAEVTRHGFCWGTSPSPEVSSSASCNLGDCAEAKDYDYIASGLEPSTQYYVRAYAENAEGVSYSNEVSFRTEGVPQLATVETGTASDVQSHQAVINGNLTHLGNVSEVSQYGHVWSTAPGPTLDDGKTQMGSTKVVCTFRSTLTDLLPATTYYVRAYAINSVGTAYGEEISFTTLRGKVEVETAAVSDITYRSATCSGRILSYGGHEVTERGVCWSVSSSPTVNGSHQAATGSGDSFVVSFAGLEENTSYYVRAYARTESGEVYYGNEVKFATSLRDVAIDKGEYGEDEDWSR